MNIFHRYVIRQHVAPFLFAFSVIMFVLILKLMLQMMELLITKGVGFGIMAQVLVYNLAWMVALVVPMSALVASVMAFGSMGASGEVVAMKAAGVSMYRIVSPVILLALLLTFGMVWFNNVILPEANYRAGSLKRAILQKKPLLSLKDKEGQFISDDDIPFTFRIDHVNDVTEEMFGITLFKRETGEPTVIVTAERGRFIVSDDRLELMLSNGELHRKDMKDDANYARSSFESLSYIVNDLNFGLDTSVASSRNDRNMTSAMMRDRIVEIDKLIVSTKRQLTNISEDEPNREEQIKTLSFHVNAWEKNKAAYLIEIHKKNSIPFAALVFVLIGASLGILVRRSGASIGIGLSIGFFTLYYLFLIGGESMGDRLILEPWLAMWLPNILLGPVGVGLFIRAARR